MMHVGRLWLPTMLSPIPEGDEPQLLSHFSIFTERRDLNGEHRGIMVVPEGAFSNQNQSAPRGLAPIELRRSVESSSGRRLLPSVEVLKQKYINDDILDIPRLIQGPVRYGRLHRSRSLLDLGSQDIKTQLNQIRLRLRTINSTDETSNNDSDEFNRPTFRCSKFRDEPRPVQRPPPIASPDMTLDRVRSLLYGSPTADDYDPELAALFEDYVEECDNPTRAPATETRLKDRYVMGRILMEKSLHSETRYALLSGFLEGIVGKRRKDEPNGVDPLERVNKQPEGNKKTSDTLPMDPCIDQSSHTKLIRSNQDITHKFLKEWEQQNSGCVAGEKADDSCFACHQKKMKQSSDADVRDTPTKMADGNEVTDSKLAKGRNLFPLSKPELDLAVPEAPRSPRSPANCMSRMFLKKLPKLQKTKPPDSPMVEALVGTKLPQSQEEDPHGLTVGRAGDATPVRITVQGIDDSRPPTPISHQFTSLGDSNYKTPPCNYNRTNRPANLIPLNSIPPTYSPKVFNDYSSMLETRRLHYDVTSDDDVSVIALAKQKIESKFTSSAKLLNDYFRNKQEERKTTKPEPLRTPRMETRDEPRAPSKGRAKLETDSSLGYLDGWETNLKHLSDPENLHDVQVSSSEVLHPISLPSTLGEQKVSKKPRGRPEIMKLPCTATSTSAKLSDLNDKTASKANYETKAFKLSSPLAGDYKAASSQVKLRLTKSCVNMPGTSSAVNIDRAFSNVPLSTCSSYYVGEKLKAIQEAGTSFNLANTLVQELKNTSRDNNLRPEHIKRSVSLTDPRPKITNSQEKRKAISTSAALPAIEHDVPVLPDKIQLFSDRKLVLPHIGKSKTPDIDEPKTPDIEKPKTPDTGKSKSPDNDESETRDTCKSKTPDTASISATPSSNTDNKDTKITNPNGHFEHGELDERGPVGNIVHEDAERKSHLTIGRSETTKLPPLSVKGYPKSNKTQTKIALSDVNRAARSSHDSGGTLLQTDSLPALAGICTSAYQFDNTDPNNLIVNAKQLHNQHAVCSSCGEVDEKMVDKPDDTKAEKRGQKDLDNGIAQPCTSPCDEQKWKLEFTKASSNKELPKLKGERLFNFKDIMNAKKQESAQSANQNRKSRPNEEELSINFMGQKIKLKFECEFNVTAEENKPDKSIPRDGSCHRLQKIAKPTCRDSLKNSLSRETGIYQKKKKPLDSAECHETSCSSGRVSPYVEYCKRKAAMRVSKIQQQESEHAKLPNDDNTVTPPCKSQKRFPVLPVKKTNRKRTTEKSRARSKEGASKACSDDKIIIQPGRLPMIKPVQSKNRISGGIPRQPSNEGVAKKMRSITAKVDSCVTCTHTFDLIYSK